MKIRLFRRVLLKFFECRIKPNVPREIEDMNQLMPIGPLRIARLCTRTDSPVSASERSKVS